jgi:catechol 2,3-dioxygenase-like lactoylglutathione lyase family enzyme
MRPRSTAAIAERAERAFSLRSRRSLRFIVGTLLFGVLHAAPGFAQQTHLLVITGVPGDEEHAQQFQKWATTFIETAKKKDSVADANVTLLADRWATREGVEKAFVDLAARVKPTDGVVVLLIGHGSFNGTQGAFNLPGPDLTVAEWATLLGKLPAQRVAFINTSSSSGAFLPAIAGPGRVVVTATKTGGERNETQFPEFFVAAFGDNAADRDRNGHVSIAEAFEYAKTKVVQAFQQKGLLLTEHATMDDGGEGRLAATMFLGIGRAEGALAVDTSDPAIKKLVDEKDAIDQQIAALKLKKGAIDDAQYDAQMETLLTDLALKTRAIRDQQAKKDKS